jgi:hypothetical protein
MRAVCAAAKRIGERRKLGFVKVLSLGCQLCIDETNNMLGCMPKVAYSARERSCSMSDDRAAHTPHCGNCAIPPGSQPRFNWLPSHHPNSGPTSAFAAGALHKATRWPHLTENCCTWGRDPSISRRAEVITSPSERRLREGLPFKRLLANQALQAARLGQGGQALLGTMDLITRRPSPNSPF